jgi:pimeloyl-ACP methyl ester carboxylesterase
MKYAVVCCAAWLWVCSAAHASGSGYRVTGVGVDAPSATLVRTVVSIQVGDDPLDRFEVIRVRQRGLPHLADPPVILLAPFAFPAEFWELSNGNYADGFASRVALAGYDVWLVPSRLAAAAPGECESGAVDCTAMLGWDQDTAIDDAMFVRRLARLAHPSKKPVIGGFSGGSSTAMAAVDRHPRAFAGLFMWEGTLYSADPAIRARNAAFCAHDEAALAAGSVFDPAVQGFKLLFELASAAPDDPSPIPAFPPGTTNLQALLFAFTLPSPENPLNFTEGFIRLVGDPFTATLTYSELERVLIWGPLVGNYAPIAFIRDTHCSIGGLETRFTDDLSEFEGPALIFVEGLGFGQMMLDTAALMTDADVTIDFHPELGESDRYFHRDWQTVALDPLLDWLADLR